MCILNNFLHNIRTEFTFNLFKKKETIVIQMLIKKQNI